MSQETGAGKPGGGRPPRDRRPLRFWQPFNDWWRSEYESSGRRPLADDIQRWYLAQSDVAWGPEKPSLQETRVHAKCLRSVSSVRDYFREYRAKKKHEHNDNDLDEDDLEFKPQRSMLNQLQQQQQHSHHGSRGRSRDSATPAPTPSGPHLNGACQSFLDNDGSISRMYSTNSTGSGAGSGSGTRKGRHSKAIGSKASGIGIEQQHEGFVMMMQEGGFYAAGTGAYAAELCEIHPGALGPDGACQDLQEAAAAAAAAAAATPVAQGVQHQYQYQHQQQQMQLEGYGQSSMQAYMLQASAADATAAVVAGATQLQHMHHLLISPNGPKLPSADAFTYHSANAAMAAAAAGPGPMSPTAAQFNAALQMGMPSGGLDVAFSMDLAGLQGLHPWIQEQQAELVGENAGQKAAGMQGLAAGVAGTVAVEVSAAAAAAGSLLAEGHAAQTVNPPNERPSHNQEGMYEQHVVANAAATTAEMPAAAAAPASTEKASPPEGSAAAAAAALAAVKVTAEDMLPECLTHFSNRQSRRLLSTAAAAAGQEHCFVHPSAAASRQQQQQQQPDWDQQQQQQQIKRPDWYQQEHIWGWLQQQQQQQPGNSNSLDVQLGLQQQQQTLQTRQLSRPMESIPAHLQQLQQFMQAGVSPANTFSGTLFSDGSNITCNDIVPPPPYAGNMQHASLLPIAAPPHKMLGVGGGLRDGSVASEVQLQQQHGSHAPMLLQRQCSAYNLAAAAPAGGLNAAGILSELEAIKGPAMAGLVDAHTAAQQQRISVSALLDAGPYGPHTLRPLSQSLDLLSLPPGPLGQRLSFNTMGSDALDFSWDCLDLDAFLANCGTTVSGAANTVAAAAAMAEACAADENVTTSSRGGAGATAAGDAVGPTALLTRHSSRGEMVAQVAPGSRPAVCWQAAGAPQGAFGTAVSVSRQREPTETLQIPGTTSTAVIAAAAAASNRAPVPAAATTAAADVAGHAGNTAAAPTTAADDESLARHAGNTPAAAAAGVKRSAGLQAASPKATYVQQQQPDGNGQDMLHSEGAVGGIVRLSPSNMHAAGLTSPTAAAAATVAPVAAVMDNDAVMGHVAATAAASGHKRMRVSGLHLSQALLLDGNMKRPRVSGLLMEMDTPRVRALAGPLATGASNSSAAAAAAATAVTPKGAVAATPTSVGALLAVAGAGSAAATAKAAARSPRGPASSVPCTMGGAPFDAAVFVKSVGERKQCHRLVLDLGNGSDHAPVQHQQQQQQQKQKQHQEQVGKLASGSHANASSSMTAAPANKSSKGVVKVYDGVIGLNLGDQPPTAAAGAGAAGAAGAAHAADAAAVGGGAAGDSSKNSGVATPTNKGYLPAMHEIERMI